MNASPRIALGCFMTECNHLGGQPTDIGRFELYELKQGQQLIDEARGPTEGMRDALQERDVDIVPLLAASTCPGGSLTSECYRQIKTAMLEPLRAALPMDGVLLSLHGSATVEDVQDPEGDLLQSIRAIVGGNTPIVATLDPHGHVTEQMIQQADALLGWETYPHNDTYESGGRAARILFDILDGKIKPTMVMGKAPVLVSGVNGQTEGDGPFADVMRFAKSHEGKDGVLSTSVFLVHPYLDLPNMGGGGLVITNDDMEKAVSLANEIADKYWSKRYELDPPVFTQQDAIARGLEIEGGPILLVETADCSGGGAAGDSVATLRALLAAKVTHPSLVPVIDPQAAIRCHEAGAGSEVELSLGHKLDPKWGDPLQVKGRVLRVGNGHFKYSGGYWGGEPGDMGWCAVLQIGAIEVLIATNPIYDWADEQFQSMGMDAKNAKFVVVKNPMNYRVGYANVARASFILDTPGPTPAVLHHVKYQNLQRPYYPADKEIPNFQPTILKGRN